MPLSATRAVVRNVNHEVARRLQDLPNDPTGVERDPIDAATGLFVLHCLHRDLLDRAAAELAHIIDAI